MLSAGVIMKEYPFCKYYDDGTIEIFANKNGYPKISGVIPAPDINHSTEEERQKTHNGACDQITLQGYIITSKRLIQNTAFDKPGQKTTLSIRYRPCKNEDEIRGVYLGIRDILKRVV
jgi:hypothetical protein